MEIPIFEMLSKYVANGRASFHTPGHKNRAGLLDSLQFLTYDLTELPDTSSLFSAGGADAIEQAERMAADVFGSELTLFSTGGCTLCIQTMLLLSKCQGKRVLFARNSHISAVHTAALLGICPVWIWPSGKNYQITCSDIEKALTSYPDVRTVFITSPDYYGNIADVRSIASLCRRKGALLIVDNAHGSHLGAFGMHPLSLGADMTADSCHKTLPVLTGGAMLHIKNLHKHGIDRSTAKAAMMMFGSTSPSFPVLASLDIARDWWWRAGIQAYQLLAESVEQLANKALKNEIGVLRGKLNDPTRLTLDIGTVGADGVTAAEFFREKGCEPEYSDSRFIVFIITPFNTPNELSRLGEAINQFPIALRRGRFLKRSQSLPNYVDNTPPETVLSPRDALLLPCETVNTDSAAGRIAARAVCPCPPGIAAVVPGEKISRDTAEMLNLHGFKRLTVVKTS